MHGGGTHEAVRVIGRRTYREDLAVTVLIKACVTELRDKLRMCNSNNMSHKEVRGDIVA